jgi:hypothetical protein
MTDWSSQTFNRMQDFAEWNLMQESEDEKNRGAAIVVLSHHGDDQLFFYSTQDGRDDPLTPEDIKRTFAQPSVAILNGCGTGGPKGSNLVRQFNQNGFAAIIAASTEVNGYMAGAFLRIFADKLSENPNDSNFTISRAFFAALRELSQIKPQNGNSYGPRVLKFLLLGNGALRLCPGQ